MKTQAVLAGFAVMIITASAAYAAPEKSGNAAVDGIGKLLRFPITMLDKASASLENAPGATSASEDVAVSEIYNLDAETTG